MRRTATLAFGLVASGAPALARENTILFALGGLACSEIKLSNAADVLAVLNAAKADELSVQVAQEMEAAVAFALKSPFPKLESALDNVYA